MSGHFGAVIYVNEDLTLCETCAMGCIMTPINPTQAKFERACWCYGSVSKVDPCKSHIHRDNVVNMAAVMEEKADKK